jgi:N-acetyltransferase
MLLAAPTLTGRHVTLEPLRSNHVDELVDAAGEDRRSYRWTMVPDGRAEMAAYVESLLTEHGLDRVVPFVQRRTGDRRIVGCTRYMDLHWWSGRGAPDEVEIGGTWLAASAQRTAINTEAKLLLMSYAFEHWEVWRLCLCTDERNARSRAAIERLGARLEGVLRHHRPSYVDGESGCPRNTAVYSILPEQWPDVADRLRARLG